MGTGGYYSAGGIRSWRKDGGGHYVCSDGPVWMWEDVLIGAGSRIAGSYADGTIITKEFPLLLVGGRKLPCRFQMNLTFFVFF